MLNSQKRFFIFTLLAYFFVSTTQTLAISEQTQRLLKTLQTATALAKLPCAITANAYELKDNENLALTLDALYRGLDISDTALKMAIDFDSVSYLEMSTEVYQLYKLGSDIATLIKNHTKNQKQNTADNSKQNTKITKKVIYSILKYLALTADSVSSLTFSSPLETDRMAASNLSSFFKIYANLIDNKKPEMRSIALTILAPIALAASGAIDFKRYDDRKWAEKQKKWKEEHKKQEEEWEKQRQKEEELRREREKQEQEEANRKQKEKEEQEKRWWESLSDEEKKQEQARRRRQQHRDNQAQFEQNFKNKQKEERNNFWRRTKIDWDSRKRAYSHGRPFKFSGVYVDPFAGMSFTPPKTS